MRAADRAPPGGGPGRATADVLDAALASLVRAAESVHRAALRSGEIEEAMAELHRGLAAAGSGSVDDHLRLAEAHLIRAGHDRDLGARAAAVLATYRPPGPGAGR
jgi:hypothetical protein